MLHNEPISAIDGSLSLRDIGIKKRRRIDTDMTWPFQPSLSFDIHVVDALHGSSNIRI